MYPRNDCKISFKYPLDHLLLLHGMISEELISKPEALDSTGDRCILVIKNGTSTGVTIGRATGIQSFVRDDDTGEISREWAIYNYDSKSGVFSAPGDSGSIVVGGLGRIGGMLQWCWQDRYMRRHLYHSHVVALASNQGTVSWCQPLPHHCHCLGTTQTWLAYPILSSCPTAFFLDHLYTIYSLTLPSTCLTPLSVELRIGNTIWGRNSLEMCNKLFI